MGYISQQHGCYMWQMRHLQLFPDQVDFEKPTTYAVNIMMPILQLKPLSAEGLESSVDHEGVSSYRQLFQAECFIFQNILNPKLVFILIDTTDNPCLASTIGAGRLETTIVLI